MSYRMKFLPAIGRVSQQKAFKTSGESESLSAMASFIGWELKYSFNFGLKTFELPIKPP